MRRLPQLLIIVGLPSMLAAQAGPTAGVWGAEGNLSSASLIRFRSEASAMVFSANANYSHGGPFISTDLTSVAFGVGARRYTHSGERTRPFRTLSLDVGHSSSGSLKQTSLGVGAEFGAAHFFTPHVSLNASGELIASALWTKQSSGSLETGTAVRFTGFRIFGGVYF